MSSPIAIFSSQSSRGASAAASPIGSMSMNRLSPEERELVHFSSNVMSPMAMNRIQQSNGEIAQLTAQNQTLNSTVLQQGQQIAALNSTVRKIEETLGTFAKDRALDRKEVEGARIRVAKAEVAVATANAETAAAEERADNAARDLRVSNSALGNAETDKATAVHNAKTEEHKARVKATLSALFLVCMERLKEYDAGYKDRIVLRVSTVGGFVMGGTKAGYAINPQSESSAATGCLAGTAASIAFITMYRPELNAASSFVREKIQEAKELCVAENIFWKPSKEICPEADQFFDMVKRNSWWSGISEEDIGVQFLLSDQASGVESSNPLATNTPTLATTLPATAAAPALSVTVQPVPAAAAEQNPPPPVQQPVSAAAAATPILQQTPTSSSSCTIM